MLIGFVLGLLLMPFGEEVMGYAIPFAMASGVPATYFLGKRRKRKSARLRIDLRTFLAECCGLANALLLGENELWDDRSREDQQGRSTVEIDRLRGQTEEKLRQLRSWMLDRLFTEYVYRAAERGPEGPEKTRLEAGLDAATRKLEALEASFAAGEAARRRVHVKHSITERLIVDIGRQIVQGIRVAGEDPITVSQCPTCHSLTIDQEESCPYCGALAAI